MLIRHSNIYIQKEVGYPSLEFKGGAITVVVTEKLGIQMVIYAKGLNEVS